MNALSLAAQLSGGLVLAPLLPGLVQHWKARLQGRRGPTPLQPYRELTRLWSKSTVDVEGAGIVYRLAPSLAAASMATAVLLVPVTADASRLGVGHDLLALLGLLALARFAVAAAAWDVANGFSLMGASRDLTISISVEATLVLSIAIAALAFALVVVAETGRQPVDNPDTHLELTMIHEGPLLEYAGRDLAFLQWTAAVRHWLVLVLAAEIFLPHPHSAWGQLALLPLALVVLCGALALVETLTAKMRILLAPRLLGVGALAALMGIISWLVRS